MGKQKEPEPKINVIIGMACQGVVKSRTAQSVASNIIKANGLVTDFLMKETCDVVSSRTWLVREAIKKGATHLLFVDSDMFFPSEALTTLLAHDKDIVGVRYHKRKFPLEWTHEAEAEESEVELFKAKFMGTGLMLIKLSVFEKIKEPWFNFGRGSEGQLVLGEDAWFIHSAKDAGIDAWLDPTLKIGHIGEFTY